MTPETAQRRDYKIRMFEQYGSLTTAVMNLATVIIDPLCYGHIPPKMHTEPPMLWIPRHRYKTEFLNHEPLGQTRPYPLPAYRIRQHFLAQDKRGYLWYTNACKFIRDEVGQGVRVALLMVDVDCHRGETDADDALNSLRAKLNIPMYVEASTNGRGLHGYIMVSFSGSIYIRHHVEGFERWVSDVSDGRITEVRGSPTKMIVAPGRLLVGSRGSLAKFPRIQSFEEAAELLEVARHPIPFSLLPTKSKSANSPSSARPSAPISPPSPCSNCVEDEKEEAPRPCPPLPLHSSSSNCVERKIGESNGIRTSGPDWAAIKNDYPPRRATMLVAHLYHELRREPTLAEAEVEYVAKGLNTGTDVDGNRAVLLQNAINYFRPRWRGGQGLDYFAYVGSLKAVVPLSEMKTANGLTITFEDLSIAYTLIRSQIDRGRLQAEVSRQLATVVWGGLQEQGYDRAFDPSRWASMKRILIRHGFVERVRVGQKYKGCDAFVLG